MKGSKDFVKETDDKPRKWLDKYFVPKFHLQLEWTKEQFAWNDANITSNTQEVCFMELKVRHNLSTAYNGETMIEEDKYVELLEHKGKVGLLVMFTDCICWFPPSKLFEECFVGKGICYGCPDETHPTTTKKWVRKNKPCAYFSTYKAIKYSYDEFWTEGTPDFV